MILLDTNLLLYASVTSFPQHHAAQRWLDQQLNATNRIGLPWPTLLSFVRLITNPRIFPSPMPMRQAWRQVEDWLASPPVWIPNPTERHQSVLGAMLEAVTASANVVADAHLAALAVEHGLILCSADTGFARFPGLRWQNPLARRPGS